MLPNKIVHGRRADPLFEYAFYFPGPTFQVLVMDCSPKLRATTISSRRPGKRSTGKSSRSRRRG